MNPPSPAESTSPDPGPAAPAATEARARRGGKARRELVTGEILQNATRLFAERGYDGTSLQDVAEAVGLTRPSLYNYVNSKEDLLAALVADVSENDAQTLHTLNLRRDIGPREKLYAMVQLFVRQRAAAPERFRVLEREESSLPEPTAQAHQQAKRAVLADMRATIAAGMAAGDFKPCDERVAALSVIGMCNWVAWWYHPGGDLSAESIADQMARNAVDMLVHRDNDESLPGPMGALKSIRQSVEYLERAIGRE
ncbi:MAG TPA: TetR/AcrR family transcriptional regulator [Actinocrinis sp.]|nr:TetR/AcrR family transcriptional regulator [Actinocrinis sp.]